MKLRSISTGFCFFALWPISISLGSSIVIYSIVSSNDCPFVISMSGILLPTGSTLLGFGSVAFCLFGDESTSLSTKCAY